MRRLTGKCRPPPSSVRKSRNNSWVLGYSGKIFCGRLDELILFAEKRGRLPIRKALSLSERRLATWLSAMQVKFRRGKLSPPQLAELRRVPHMENRIKQWRESASHSWSVRCKQLEAFVRKHLHFPRKSATDVREQRLSIWVSSMRQRYRQGKLGKVQHDQLSLVPGFPAVYEGWKLSHAASLVKCQPRQEARPSLAELVELFSASLLRPCEADMFGWLPSSSKAVPLPPVAVTASPVTEDAVVPLDQISHPSPSGEARGSLASSSKRVWVQLVPSSTQDELVRGPEPLHRSLVPVRSSLASVAKRLRIGVTYAAPLLRTCPVKPHKNTSLFHSSSDTVECDACCSKVQTSHVSWCGAPGRSYLSQCTCLCPTCRRGCLLLD